MSTKITAAQSENVPEIIALCYQNFAEIKERGENSLPKPSTIKALSSMQEFVDNGLVFVKKEENGTIVGVLVLTPFDFWWSEETVLHTATLYVVPEYRNKSVFNELIDEATAYADHSKVKLYNDVMLEDELEKMDILMRRKGFKKTGSIYVYGSK